MSGTEEGPGPRPPRLAAPRVHPVHGADPLAALRRVHREPMADGEREARKGRSYPPRPPRAAGPPRGTATLTGGRRCRAPGSARCRGRCSPAPSSSVSWRTPQQPPPPAATSLPAACPPIGYRTARAVGSLFSVSCQATAPHPSRGRPLPIRRGSRLCGTAVVPPRCDVSRRRNGNTTKRTGCGGGGRGSQ